MVHIPKPCHEDWQQMTPVDQGRFCQSCAKQVVDFSLMTDQQILQYISKAAGGMCGRFANDQLQRPLLPVKQEKKKMWWLVAAVPLMMAFGKVAAQKKTNKSANQIVIKIDEQVAGLFEVADGDDYSQETYRKKPQKFTIKKQKNNTEYEIEGQVIDEKKNTVPFANVSIKGFKEPFITDADGNFIIRSHTNSSHLTLNVNSIGFESTDVEVSLKDTDAAHTDTLNIHGHIIDSDNGYPVQYAIVTVKNEKQFTTADAAGDFNLNFLPKRGPAKLIVTWVGYQDKEIPLTLNGLTSTIKLETIKLKPSQQSLSDIVVVGGAVACYRKPKIIDTIPTLIRKVFHTETFTIYPNPTPRGQSITIDTKKEGNYSIQIFDNSGKLLQVKEFNAAEDATQTTIDIPSTFAAGMYYIRLVDDKTKMQYTDKIVVR